MNLLKRRMKLITGIILTDNFRDDFFWLRRPEDRTMQLMNFQIIKRNGTGSKQLQ